MPANFYVNLDDLNFILQQIKIAERHVAGESLQSIIGADANLLPYGLRAVDGTENNLLPGGEKLGAADTLFPRMMPTSYITDTKSGAFSLGPGATVTNNNYANAGNVVDANPRTISNLIVDQSVTNPAAVEAWFANPVAVAAWEKAHPGKTPVAPGSVLGANEIALTNADLNSIPNVSPDIGLSPGFNGWMTFFGQFFDHGLDLVTKGANGSVYIPLQPDDPLYVPGGHTNFMVLTRATPATDPVTGQPTATNTTTSWIDQNQTYTSHASHQVFLREYRLTVDSDNDGTPDRGAMATGKLLDGHNPDGSTNHAVANWGEVKANALTMLGIKLVDTDVLNVPLLATDQYGEFIRGPNGYAQIVMKPDATHAANWLLEGSAAGTLVPAGAFRTGHAFLDDIAETAKPVSSRGVVLTADADTTVGDHLFGTAPGTYDNELLDKHFITGDGRGNENIGLTAVHTIFHAEHNRLVDANKETILKSGDLAVINEWLATDITALPVTEAEKAALNWDGERLFQAAKFVTEMQYQHLVFEEFARKVQPNVDPFVFTNTADIDPSITAEFAHVVYRFGHSMLTDSVARLDNSLASTDIGLIQSFLNPVEFSASGGSTEEATATIIRGMTRQVGNEIDEFVVDSLRNNLLGLPLDLAALNMARAREQGVPSFNMARAQFFEQTGDIQLKPYESWSDYTQNLKNPLSIINFIAAYGTHSSIVSATTLEAKRDAATLLVLGDVDVTGDGIAETAPTDRIDFLNHTGTWAAKETGLNNVDFWIGGLAEVKMEFGGMLGTTFNFVFENQLEKLQNGDRFYYLSRTQGLNILNQLEPNTFSELVMRNSALGDLHATHLPGSLFDTVDYTLELDPLVKQITGLNADGSYNPLGTADPRQATAQAQQLNPKVVRVAPGADVDGDGWGDGGSLKFAGGEHVVLGGTEGNDRLTGDKGIDTLWGDGGNDYLNAGSESDQVFGGDGDDIIVDPFGDDMLRGENGNDVISGGPGFDLLFGGAGQDFITGSTDPHEIFGGEESDFILGGTAADNLLGNEGDDWIEGGDGFDSLSGENSQLFFNSTIVGHDVLNGQGNDTDYDGEAGDDIMFQGPGIQRNNGMDGFDWSIHKGDPNAANSDLGISRFDTRQALILRDRNDSVEGLSGWKYNDVLTGAAKFLPQQGFNNVLTQAGIDRIAGLRDLLGVAPGAPDAVGFDPGANIAGGDGLVTPTGGEIILGGAGSDIITGNLGDDVIDGDYWLNVRIEVHQNKDGTGPVLRSIDSLNEIKSQLLAGTINPGQLKIVREIVNTGASASDVDTAVYNGDYANYGISAGPVAGSFVITDLVGTDGTDIVRNIERLQFADQIVVLSGSNTPAVGTVTISDTTPTEKQVLTVSLSGVADANGIKAGTTTYQWQMHDGAGWLDIPNATGTSFTPGNSEAGHPLQVVVHFIDNLGGLETLYSAETAPVIAVNDAPTDILAGPLSVAENAANGTVIGTLTGVDPDSTALTFSLVNPDGRFALSAAGELTVADGLGLDFEQAASHTVRVRVSDGQFSFEKDILVDVSNVAPETVTGDARANIIQSGFGEDVLDGGAGADTLAGGGGNDRYFVDNAGDVVTEELLGGTDDIVYASANWTMTAGSEIEQLIANAGTSGLTLEGNELANYVQGGAGADTLRGGGGNDVLNGLAGADTMAGGAGDDTYQLDNLLDTVDESVAGSGGTDTVQSSLISINLGTTARFKGAVENIVLQGALALSATGNGLANTILGNDAANTLDGGAGNDVLIGGGGNDLLIGGGGADRMEGGLGNDSYNVNDAGDTIVELVGQGTADLVQTSVSFALTDAQEIEQLRAGYAIGGAGITLSGNVFGNTITGGSGADTLNGNGGNDLLTGGDGTDTLNGGDGDDTLNGGTGADAMAGGAGNDTYYVDNAGDAITETAGQGTADIVLTTVNFTLTDAQAIEQLKANYAAGAPGLTLTGNALANAITGGASADTLNGGGGDDVLNGGLGADQMAGGLGNDTYHVDNAGDTITELAGEGTGDIVLATVNFALTDAQNIEQLKANYTAGAPGLTLTGNGLANLIFGGASADTLNGGGGNDTLTANEGADTLNGGDGDDTLNGGTGADAMAGGAGNDVYYVDNAGDTVTELAGQGTGDVIQTTVSFALTDAQNIEHMRANYAAGAPGVSLSGNAFVNNLIGGSSADTLNGGGGNDVLTGGAGSDTFVFKPGFGRDTVMDFTAGAASDDVIQFDTSAFANYAAVMSHATQVGADTVITLDAGNTVTLKKVALSSLHVDDFRFV